MEQGKFGVLGESAPPTSLVGSGRAAYLSTRLRLTEILRLETVPFRSISSAPLPTWLVATTSPCATPPCAGPPHHRGSGLAACTGHLSMQASAIQHRRWQHYHHRRDSNWAGDTAIPHAGLTILLLGARESIISGSAGCHTAWAAGTETPSTPCLIGNSSHKSSAATTPASHHQPCCAW